MPFDSPIFDFLFLISVTFIWLMIIYQLVLTFAGNRYRRKISIEHQIIMIEDPELPPVSVIIPARDEAVVIEKTIQRILNLDYPREALELIIVNDGSSDDTALLVEKAAQNDQRIKLINLPFAETGHGKAHVLNIGLENASHEIIAVYDADNQPEAQALRIMVPHLLSDNSIAAVIGKFRTMNRLRNWLTRWINIETVAFQWILQAGRYYLSELSILPGTNYVIKKSVLQACGGWDDKAITEDSELSVRIYQEGYKIKFVPLAITWEQEPEKLTVWLRQRTRWVRGNNYVLRKNWREIYRSKSKFLVLEFVYLFALYYIFLGAIFVSLLLFLLGATDVITLTIPGPYTGVWISAFFLFVLEIIVVLSYENEDSLLNIFLTTLMYFTYCQLWLFVVFKALILDVRRHRTGIWDKTERFEIKEIAEEET